MAHAADTPVPANLDAILSTVDVVAFSMSLARDRVLYVSPQAEAWYGAPVDVLLQHPMFWRTNILPEDQDGVARAWITLKPGLVHTFIYRLTGADDKRRLIRHRAWIVEDPMNRPLRIDNYLEILQERFPVDALARHPDPVFVMDGQGGILNTNHAARELWLAEPEPLIGRRISVCLSSWSQGILEVHALPTAREQGVWRGELAFALPGGVEAPHYCTVVRVDDANGISMVLFTQDLRNQRRREQALRQHQNRLDGELFMARRLLDNLSLHSLPALENIEALAVMALRDHAQSLPGDVQNTLEVIKGSVRQLLRLSRSIKEFSDKQGEPPPKV